MHTLLTKAGYLGGIVFVSALPRCTGLSTGFSEQIAGAMQQFSEDVRPVVNNESGKWH